jgi:hypothetical protein
VLVVALADAVLLLASVGLGLSRIGDEPASDPADLVPVLAVANGLPARPSPGSEEVTKRPWPSRVEAPGPWSATLAGKGDRIVLSTPGTITGGIAHATYDFGPMNAPQPPGTPPRGTRRLIVLPDGTRWEPTGKIRLEGPGDVAFSTLEIEGQRMFALSPSLEAGVGSAVGGVTAVGTFVQPQGGQVDRLALAPGTRMIDECRDPTTCWTRGEPSLGLTVTPVPGMSIRSAGDGEVAVAGATRTSALGRSWDGLVATVEAKRLQVSASYAGNQWTVAAEARLARQVWVDAWPVVDTELEAKSVIAKPGFIRSSADEKYPVRIRWKNVGHATSQIYVAEGSGGGASSVGFGLSSEGGHDAGLGVHRASRVVNLDDGGAIDSRQAPGKGVDRGLSTQRGTSASITLRGNFPTVEVPVADPAS